MKKIIALSMLLTVLLLSANTSFAGGRNGKVTPKSIGAGALSLLIWPGIGQLPCYSWFDRNFSYLELL